MPASGRSTALAAGLALVLASVLGSVAPAAALAQSDPSAPPAEATAAATLTAPAPEPSPAYGPKNEKPEDEKSLAERRAAAEARRKELAAAFEKCKEQVEKAGTIVVCADPHTDDSPRLPLRDEREASKSTHDGLPRAPDVYGAKPVGIPLVTIKGCFLSSCPPPPVYYIDLKAIPEAPKGSDADKVGHGEMAQK